MTATSVRGDDRRSAWDRPPELIASEEHILTLADGLLTWMQREEIVPDSRGRADFLTHTEPGGKIEAWVLERTDPDANRMFIELLRAAWQRRVWQVRLAQREKAT